MVSRFSTLWIWRMRYWAVSPLSIHCCGLLVGDAGEGRLHRVDIAKRFGAFNLREGTSMAARTDCRSREVHGASGSSVTTIFV
jgi:hypothetical protein